MEYDVIIIGSGPSGMYAGLIIQKGTPIQSVPENFHIKIIEAGKYPGGLTKYAFIQISKGWAFHGRNLIGSLYKESIEAGVEYSFEEVVIQIEKKNGVFIVITNKARYCSKYVIIATGILTFPDVLSMPDKMNIGLHTPEEMAKEFITEYKWQKVLVVGNVEKSVNELCENLKKYFKIVKVFIFDKEISISDLDVELSEEIKNQFDGIIFDYNSYKLMNGTTSFLKNLKLDMINGYIVTDNFGETNIPNLYAVGTVTMPTSGIMAAIYSAQIAAFSIGRKLCKKTKADISGRFPFFPREFCWDESYQAKLKKYKLY